MNVAGQKTIAEIPRSERVEQIANIVAAIAPFAAAWLTWGGAIPQGYVDAAISLHRSAGRLVASGGAGGTGAASFATYSASRITNK